MIVTQVLKSNSTHPKAWLSLDASARTTKPSRRMIGGNMSNTNESTQAWCCKTLYTIGLWVSLLHRYPPSHSTGGDVHWLNVAQAIRLPRKCFRPCAVAVHKTCGKVINWESQWKLEQWSSDGINISLTHTEGKQPVIFGLSSPTSGLQSQRRPPKAPHSHSNARSTPPPPQHPRYLKNELQPASKLTLSKFGSLPPRRPAIHDTLEETRPTQTIISMDTARDLPCGI